MPDSSAHCANLAHAAAEDDRHGGEHGLSAGWVHFSARCGKETNLLDFFRAHKPAGADSRTYGQGHDQAGGGALPVPIWNTFVQELGFGPEMLVDPSPETVTR